ncbi:MAG: 3-carboxy-cis,cis-muconate cycloisomerase, partial [Variovorax sp.]
TALPGLQVDSARMLANIERLRAELPKDAADEWFNPALAQHAGQLTLAQVGQMRKAAAPKKGNSR